MTDPPSRPIPGRPQRPGPRSAPGVPRWVKTSGIIVAILVLALVVIMFIGRTNLGPSRHANGTRPAPPGTCSVRPSRARCGAGD